LPLDGEDDVGLFYILIPQPLDRSIKKLEELRLYEVRNEGDGKIFDNNIMLFTLRNPKQDSGTVELVREIIESGGSPCRPASVQRVQELASSVNLSEIALATEATEPREAPLAKDGPKRRTQDATSTSRNKKCRTIRTKKQVTGSKSGELPPTEPHVRYLAPTASVGPQRSPALTAISAAEKEPALDVRQTVKPTVPNQVPTSIVDASEHITTPRLRSTDEQARNIQIVWALEVEGKNYELPLTMAECNSFTEMLEVLHNMAESLPFASALLGKTTHWRMSLTLPNGTETNKMTRKGTEVAFDRTRKELAQGSCSDGDTVEIELRAIA
jgi:hypothetical protein